MKWLASVFVGICAVPLAAIIVGTAADSWASWLRVSTREGAAGYWVVMMAVLASVCALVLGISLARGWLLTTPNFWSALGSTVGLTAAVTLLLTGLIRLGADLPPRVDGRRLQLVAEVRFPADTTLESLKEAAPHLSIRRVDSGDSRGSGNLMLESASEIDGRLVVPVTMDIQTSARRKMLHLGYTGRDVFFPLDFSAKPDQKDLDWSGWISALPTTPAESGGTQLAGSVQSYEARYKVIIEPPPAPRLTREQEEAAADAKQEAAMRVLAPDAPLAQWLVFTRYGVPQPRIDAAIAAIRARPAYAAEMEREMLAGEYESSRDALRAIAHIKPPPREFANAIAAAGMEIAQSLRDLEKEPAESRTHDERVSSISTRFSAWMEATRAVQESKVADFVPQLQEIIDPARRLDQVHAIRMDVVRVASFYLNKWAGIAPLPSDPPPR